MMFQRLNLLYPFFPDSSKSTIGWCATMVVFPGIALLPHRRKGLKDIHAIHAFHATYGDEGCLR